MLSISEITKKTKMKSHYQGQIWKKQKKSNKNPSVNKQVNSGCMSEWLGGEQCAQEKHSCSAHFSSLFALLSFWDLICNDEFNSGSSCLN